MLLFISYNNSGLNLDTIKDTGEGTENFVSDIKKFGFLLIHLDTSGPE